MTGLGLRQMFVCTAKLGRDFVKTNLHYCLFIRGCVKINLQYIHHQI